MIGVHQSGIAGSLEACLKGTTGGLALHASLPFPPQDAELPKET